MTSTKRLPTTDDYGCGAEMAIGVFFLPGCDQGTEEQSRTLAAQRDAHQSMQSRLDIPASMSG